ncbi:hypothetical protein [Kistimonas asteriae]|uniref:hypothetical protein n=1 Tax=Kistimonas asteriae TaxID=517724 RepID=UPI001BAB52FF|nr:hypothetical protein [Kistimonas asteriae]
MERTFLRWRVQEELPENIVRYRVDMSVPQGSARKVVYDSKGEILKASDGYTDEELTNNPRLIESSFRDNAGNPNYRLEVISGEFGRAKIYMIKAFPQVIFKKRELVAPGRSCRENALMEAYIQQYGLRWLVVPKVGEVHLDDMTLQLETWFPIAHKFWDLDIAIYKDCAEGGKRLLPAVKDLAKLCCYVVLPDRKGFKYNFLPIIRESSAGEMAYQMALVDLEGFEDLSRKITEDPECYRVRMRKNLEKIVEIYPWLANEIIDVAKIHNQALVRESELNYFGLAKAQGLDYYKREVADYVDYIRQRGFDIQSADFECIKGLLVDVKLSCDAGNDFVINDRAAIHFDDEAEKEFFLSVVRRLNKSIKAFEFVVEAKKRIIYKPFEKIVRKAFEFDVEEYKCRMIEIDDADYDDGHESLDWYFCFHVEAGIKFFKVLEEAGLIFRAPKNECEPLFL